MNTRPRIGDRVIVPFGFGEVEGQVIRIDQRGDITWVSVTMYIDNGEGTMLNIFPLNEVRPARAA